MKYDTKTKRVPTWVLQKSVILCQLEPSEFSNNENRPGRIVDTIYVVIDKNELKRKK
jgi:hypothetical protein